MLSILKAIEALGVVYEREILPTTVLKSGGYVDSIVSWVSSHAYITKQPMERTFAGSFWRSSCCVLSVTKDLIDPHVLDFAT